MTHLQLLALIAMSATKSRSELDPFNYQGLGIDWYVERMIASPIECLQKLIKRTTGREWDGKENLWPYLIEQLRQDALIHRVFRQFGEIDPGVKKKYRYIQAYEQMTNMDHECESQATQEYVAARKDLLEYKSEVCGRPCEKSAS